MRLKNFYLYSCFLFYASVCFSHNEFNTKLLGGDSIDLSVFDEDVVPGDYYVDIYLNDEYVSSRFIKFTYYPTLGKTAPCISSKMLLNYGIDTQSTKNNECIRNQSHRGFDVRYNRLTQGLFIYTPNDWLSISKNRGIPTKLLDNGINAFILNYKLIFNKLNLNGYERNNGWLRLAPGINFGSWRVRGETSYSHQEKRWQSPYLYAERGFYGQRALLTLGQGFTSGDIIESVPFTGIMMGTDDSMIASDDNAYTPVVQGIAKTQARIEIRQKGYLIYTKTVSPGSFSINDVPFLSNAGNLYVTILESDGSRQVFSVPYQQPVKALREGRFRYNVMLGEYRPINSRNEKHNNGVIWDSSLMYGLPWGVTLYSGLQGVKNYQLISLGAGKSLGYLGSLSADASLIKNQYDRTAESGAKIKFIYNNNISQFGTYITLTNEFLTSMRYSSINDFMSHNSDEIDYTRHIKNKLNVGLSQLLPNGDGIGLNYSNRRFYHDGDVSNYGINYRTNFHYLSMNFNASQTYQNLRNNNFKKEYLINLSFNMPFDLFGSKKSRMNLNLLEGKNASAQLGLNGNAFNDQLWWNINHSYNDENSGSGSIGLSWDASEGQVTGGYSYGRDYNNLDLGVNGGMILYDKNIIFSQYLYNTIAIIKSPGLYHAQVGNNTGVKTDYRGYAAISGLSPYRKNTVYIDSTNLSENVEIRQTEKTVIPTSKAIVEINYPTKIGSKVIFKIKNYTEKGIPFGASASINNKKESAGLVDGYGQLYLSGMSHKGSVIIDWKGGHCHFDYDLTPLSLDNGIYYLTRSCH
ncbi:outer membrane usher protein [Providencia alcalifaciens]|uniref:Outer membrane usher protein n=1 Tax=Providencia alcalifaciens TaxID=126385 RepID=A0A4R3NEY5_9GAMM|nr:MULTISPECIES: fimbria/pilus outer membrane usher protein [Providencia]MBC5792394.1 fimbrial biogenesis outer membrane usher protein [Providencia sp. JUb39]TCT28811.1 outer membrane usher protein [Providencia alcalifaciens]